MRIDKDNNFVNNLFSHFLEGNCIITRLTFNNELISVNYKYSLKKSLRGLFCDIHYKKILVKQEGVYIRDKQEVIITYDKKSNSYITYELTRLTRKQLKRLKKQAVNNEIISIEEVI